jgi:hypothetical protein
MTIDGFVHDADEDADLARRWRRFSLVDARDGTSCPDPGGLSRLPRDGIGLSGGDRGLVDLDRQRHLFTAANCPPDGAGRARAGLQGRAEPEIDGLHTVVLPRSGCTCTLRRSCANGRLDRAVGPDGRW